jgi:hypothetical protein
MIYFLLLMTTLLSWAETPTSTTPAKTNFDLNGGLQGRTLPGLGAELYGEGGYNFIAWGKKEEPKDFLYGLIRPNIGVSTSGVINSIRAELEVFPISIFGVAVGRQYLNSNFEFPFFDCEEVTCKGEYIRNYVETKMVLGHKGWVVLGNYRVDTVRAPNSTMPMVDWRNVIVGEPGEEVEIEKKLLIAKLFSNKLVGVLIENVQFQGSGERKESFAAIYQVRKDNTNYMIGAGGFHTDQQPMGFQIYFRIHHVALPSLKLF